MQDPNIPEELPAADPNLNVGDANNADREGPDDRGEPEELFEEARQDPIIVETVEEDSDGEDETAEPQTVRSIPTQVRRRVDPEALGRTQSERRPSTVVEEQHS